jgi:DNA primase
MLLSASQRKSLERATSAYEANVDQVAGYLTARGISRETARTYRLGYVAEPVRGDDEYAGRLSIPYITTSGVVDIRYRALDTDGPKYLSRPGAKTRLFGVTALLKPSPVIVLTEGEVDCMTVNQCGVAAVGVPGANAWKDYWRLLFLDYEEVIAVCDGDQAGRDFGKKVAERVDGATVVHMPDGMDVNELFVRDGAAAVLERIGL